MLCDNFMYRSGALNLFHTKLLLVVKPIIFAIFILSSSSFASIVVKGGDSAENAESQSQIRNLLSAEDTSQKRLVVAVGADALTSHLSSGDNTPVIAVMITSAGFKSVIDQFPNKPPGNVSAIFADSNPNIMVALAKALSKNSRVLIARTTATSSVLALDQSWKAKDVELVTLAPGDTKNVIARMDHFDILVAIPDKTLYNATTMQPIVSSLYRRQKFIIGYSKGMTNGGALASVASDQRQVDFELLKFTRAFAKSGILPPPAYPVEFSIYLNRVLSHSLGIDDIDESVLRNDIQLELGETK